MCDAGKPTTQLNSFQIVKCIKQNVIGCTTETMAIFKNIHDHDQ